VLVASTSRLHSDPGYAGAVRRFVAAFLAGSGAAMNNPGAATTVMRGVSQYSPAFLQASVPYTLKLIGQRGGLPTGCLDLAAWRDFGNWLKAHKLVHDIPDAAAVMTDKYLPHPSCPGRGGA
jgi:hypothetical protein